MLLVATAHALTPPVAGAAALPPGAELSLPFPAGTAVVVTCGYGPDCSGSHAGIDSPTAPNDYYALDLVRDQAGDGEGEVVVAAAGGRVVMAQWATGDWSGYGRMVLVEHDLGDGHLYQTLYAHLSAIDVSVGQDVEAKDPIGRMGGSGDMTDDAFTAHLHFAVHQDASWAGGPYGGRATVPEPIDAYEDLVEGARLVAAGGPEGAAPQVVDDSDAGFLLSGAASLVTKGGYRDHFWYAPAEMAATTRAWWTPEVGRTGLYTVSAYVPLDHATTTRAPYTIVSAGERLTTTVDQSGAGGGFLELAPGRTFKLVAGADHHVELHDGTGEAAGAEVAFDAVRFTWAADAGTAEEGAPCASSAECSGGLVCGEAVCHAPCDCADGTACDEETGQCGAWRTEGSTTTDTGLGTTTRPAGDSGTGGETGSVADTGEPETPRPAGSSSGCGCAEAGSGSGVLTPVAAWLVVAGRRRRSPRLSRR